MVCLEYKIVYLGMFIWDYIGCWRVGLKGRVGVLWVFVWFMFFFSRIFFFRYYFIGFIGINRVSSVKFWIYWVKSFFILKIIGKYFCIINIWKVKKKDFWNLLYICSNNVLYFLIFKRWYLKKLVWSMDSSLVSLDVKRKYMERVLLKYK